jgi:hypothetical protein
MKFEGILCGLAACLCVGCASQADDVAGNNGGGIEIPNGLTVVVKDSAGGVVAGAHVRRLAASRWSELAQAGKAVVLDDALTDADGKASLSWEKGSDAWIEVLDGASRGVRAAASDSGRMSVQVAALQRLSGTWPDSLLRPSRLRLAGTARYSSLDASGNFVFDAVPQGAYELVAEVAEVLHPAGSGNVDGQGTQQLALSLDTGALVLDDFKDGDNIWKLTDLFGPGYWWISSSETDTKKVFGIESTVQAIHSDSGRHYFGVVVSETDTSVWSNFGVSMGSGYVYPDVQNMRDLRMTVRGGGHWRAILNVADESGNSEMWQTSDTLPVDSTWKTLRLRPENFRLVADPAKAWTGTKRLLKPILQVQGGGWMDLREIALEGVPLEAWRR